MSRREQVAARQAFDVLSGEWAAVVQFPRLAVRAPGLLGQPRGRGAPVLVLPGRGVNDASTVPLRGYLSALGYRCQGWGIGVNDGDVGRLVTRVVPALEVMAEAAGRPVALVGQSMGGTVAREVARAHPDLVDRIITLGTPLFRPRSRRPIRCPVTVLYSRADRIVPPQWAIDDTPGVENIEISSTHFGMGIDPDVWRLVAQHLRPLAAASADGSATRAP